MQWLEPMPVRDWMHRDPVVVRADAPIAVATDLLRTRKIRHLPVVEGTRLVGIVTEHDVLKALAATLPCIRGADPDTYLW